MATNGVSSSTGAAHLAQQIRPKNPAEQLQPETAAEADAKANQAQQLQQATKTEEPLPVVNDRGQTTGRIVNVTA
jgi:hypothetical protein